MTDPMVPTANHVPTGTIPAVQTPLARILAHEAAYWSCVADVEARSHWLWVNNPAFPRRINANHAGHVRAPAGAERAIVAEIIAVAEAAGVTPAVYVDVLPSPDTLIPTLRVSGFQEWPAGTDDLLVYVGPDAERPAVHPVDIVTTPQARAAWVAIGDETDLEARHQLALLHAREIADPRVTAYLATVDGQPAARGHLFSTDGLGRVEAVHTLTAYRGRGLAAAIVRRAIQDSLSRGNALTYIYAEPGGAAQRLYLRLGFRMAAPSAIRAFMR